MKSAPPRLQSFMNRQEAIQQQIDSIMDSFDFQMVIKVMEFYKSMDRPYPTDWFENEEFCESAIRADARECMKSAVKESYAGRSYFEARFLEGEDNDGPWVKIEFNFGDHSYNDGTSYEKTTTTTSVTE